MAAPLNKTASSHSVEETIGLGAQIAVSLTAGDIVALVGDLGAGKTHLAKGIVKGLESPADVASPTFTLVHEYAGGRLPIAHFDWYRMDSADEVTAIGWEEYLDEFSGVIIVEWADRFSGLLPGHTRWWRLTAPNSGSRLLSRIAAPGAGGAIH